MWRLNRGRKKSSNGGKIVAGFCMGSRALYDFVDDNPLIEMRDISYVNDTAVIRTNPRVTAINSALEVDITGQVCADSLGSNQYSGVGGQVDFIRGAALSPGQAHHRPDFVDQPWPVQDRQPAETRRQCDHQPGHVHYVVTEYGSPIHGRTCASGPRAHRHCAPQSQGAAGAGGILDLSPALAPPAAPPNHRYLKYIAYLIKVIMCLNVVSRFGCRTIRRYDFTAAMDGLHRQIARPLNFPDLCISIKSLFNPGQLAVTLGHSFLLLVAKSCT